MGRRRMVPTSTAIVAFVVVGLGACGQAASDSRPPATTSARRAAPATTQAPTTLGPTTSPPTTPVPSTAPPTTAIVLPVPSPPPDPQAREPIVPLGTITIPKIGVSMPMFEGVSEGVLDAGPGHWPGTAMPGQWGNVVVAGHRVSKHRVFRHLDQLAAGDEIVYDVNGQRTVYTVDRTEVVAPDALWIVEQQPVKTTTLFACHPPGSTRERIVVFATMRQP